MIQTRLRIVTASLAYLSGIVTVSAVLAAVPDMSAISTSAQATEFGARATWQEPSAAELRDRVFQWLEVRRASAEIRSETERLWPPNETKAPDITDLLDRVGQSIALVEPAAKTVVEFCAKHPEGIAVPDFEMLTDPELDPFARNNLRLLLGRWLVQERYYDEARTQLGELEPQEVVDPASLLFYQSVCYHWFLDKQQGLRTIGKLFERREELPRRYATMGMLMQADLSALKDESLDHISRRMNDITRRLDFGNAGKKVQGVENGVIASLDKLIEELEQQAQGSGSGSGGGQGQNGSRGPAQGIQSSGPAADSNLAQGKGAGNVDKRRIGSSSGWGDLPAKEREEALQQIGKDFPSHYREIVESYFRKIAESE